MSPTLVLAGCISALLTLLGVIVTVATSRRTSSEDLGLKRRQMDAVDKDKLDQAKAEFHKEQLDHWRERINEEKARADEFEKELIATKAELKAEREKHTPKDEPFTAHPAPFSETSAAYIELKD